MLRVMTWNLWWRFGPWEQRQEAIAEVVVAVAPDILGIQEVWAEEGGPNQAEILAERLGGFHVAQGELRFRDGLAFTNAIISRWPFASVEEVYLPKVDGTDSVRRVIGAIVAAPFGRVPVFTTHLTYQPDLSAERVAQVAGLADMVDRLCPNPEVDFPALVTGDFNAVPDSDEIRMLTGRAAVPVPNLVLNDVWDIASDGSPGHTWCSTNPYLADSFWPRRRLDYLFVRWPRTKPIGNPISAHLAGNEAVDGVFPSDHYALYADFRTN